MTAAGAAVGERDVVGAPNIAKRLEVSERTVRRWWKSGVLPARKGPGESCPLRISRADLDAFKASRS